DYSNNLEVKLDLEPLPLASLMGSGNAGAVAQCLDQLQDTPCSNQSAVMTALFSIPTQKELNAALLQLQPSAFTSLAVEQQNALFYLRNTMYTRIETQLHSCCFTPFTTNRN